MLAKRIIMYVVGILLIAFSVSLHIHHNLGNVAIDNFNYVLSQLTNIEVGYITIIVCMTLVIAYFIKKRNKDIFISIIGVFTLGLLINFYNDIIFGHVLTYDNSSYLVRIIEFFLALNIASIGIVIILKTKLSMLALEQGVIVLNELKPFRKLNFGQARIILDTILVVLALIIEIFILENFKTEKLLGTLLLMVLGGLFVNIYLKIYAKLFEKNKQSS